MKTYEECKIEVAKEQGWSKLVTGHLSKYYDKAAELYAAQFNLRRIKYHYPKLRKRSTCF